MRHADRILQKRDTRRGEGVSTHGQKGREPTVRIRRPDWASGFLVSSSGSASDGRGVLDKSLSSSEPQSPIQKNGKKRSVSGADAEKAGEGEGRNRKLEVN